MKYFQFSLQVIERFIKITLGVCGIFLYANSAYAASFGSTGTPDVATILMNFAETVPNLMRLVTALAYVMGFWFVIKGVTEFKHFGESRSMMSQEHHISKPITYLTVGAMLIYLPSAVQVGMSTFWASPNPYGYLPSSGGSWTDLTNAAFMVIQLVGTIAFIRGLLILNHTSGGGGQPGTFAKAMAHIIAGILCINLYQFLQAVFSTLGIGNLSP